MASSTVRYGGAHKKRRAALLRQLAHSEGSACPRCGQAMFSSPMIAAASGMATWAGRVELDHWPLAASQGGTETVLSHSRCNRLAGARLGRAAQVAAYQARGLPPPRPRRTRQAQAWVIGPQYRRSPRW